MLSGPQQLTERQKGWPMGHALKYEHGWLTSVGRRWTKKKWYITSEISHKGGPKGCSWEVRRDGNSYPWTRSPSPRGVRSSGFVFLALTWSSPTSTQTVALLEPSFWTHSLQIHCNGSVGPRSHPPLGPVQKLWPYSCKRSISHFK